MEFCAILSGLRRFFLIFLVMSAWGLTALALEVRTPSGSFSLKDRSWDGITWFCAEDLAAALHGTYGKDPVSTYPSLNLGGKRILISTASVVVSVEGKIVKIQHVPVQKEGCLWLPVEFLTMALPAALGGPVTTGPGLPGAGAPGPGPAVAPPKPGEPKLPLPLPGEPKPPPGEPAGPVTYEVVVSADTVRLTLTGPAAPLADIKQVAREVVITLPKGSFSGGSKDVGEGIVEKIHLEQGSSRLSVVLGATFQRAESLKLRNPDRLVVIFKGEKQTVSAIPPTPPPVTPETPPKPETPPPPAMTAPPVKTQAIDVVVLDPGHGGGDTGAIGPTGLQEKDITLVLAQRLAAGLEKMGLKVILTRTTDTNVPLMERTALANYNQADLFVSIHLNSSPSHAAKGAETYYLSKQATDVWSSELAARENTDFGESATPARGQLDMVLWDLAQTSYIVESAALAERIQFEFNTLLDTKDRGVRQAPFVVLEGAQMPAVLVEVAFLSNPREGKRLSDSVFQDQVAFALGKAIRDFKARNEKPTQAPAP